MSYQPTADQGYVLVGDIAGVWVTVSTDGDRPTVDLDVIDRSAQLTQEDALSLADGIRRAADIVALFTRTD